MSTYEPNKAYDINMEVSLGKSVELSHGKMQFKVRSEDKVVSPYQSLICKYHNILAPYIKERILTEDEFRKYYQKPKLLSQELYGTPELWSGILYINNMVSVANFTQKNIKVFSTNILSILEEMVTICSDDLETNRNECYPDE